jgi:hypothetical protein
MKLPPDVRRHFVDGVADVRQENDPIVFVAHFRVDTLFDVFLATHRFNGAHDEFLFPATTKTYCNKSLNDKTFYGRNLFYTVVS